MASNVPETSFSKASTHVKVKVVQKIEERIFITPSGEEVRYGLAYCLDENSQIRELNVNAKLIPKVEEGCFLLLRNVSLREGTYRVTANSKIFKTSQFKYSREVEDKFLNPPVMKVNEAAMSPEKSRVSVTGVIQRVDCSTNQGTHKRKILFVSETMDAVPFKVKVWGTSGDIKIPSPKSKVTIRNLNVSEYNGRRDFDSTNRTEIEEDVAETLITDVIEAADFDEDSPSIILKGECYSVSKEHLVHIFPDNNFKEAIVTATLQGTHITSIRLECYTEESFDSQ